MLETTTISSALDLLTPDGAPATASDLVTAELNVVQLVRYFGCLPCQEYLVELAAAGPDLATRGASVSAVAGSADYQARWLRDERGVAAPLYLDRDGRFRDAVGAGRNLGVRLLDPRGAAAYVRSLRHGFRPQAVTHDTVRSPGVVILDRDLRVRWRYVGKRIGDYPSVAQVTGAVSTLAGEDR